MASEKSFTITTTYVDGDTSTLSGVRNHASARFIQEARMADDNVVRCEIRNDVTGLVQGRCKPKRDDADMLRAELERMRDWMKQQPARCSANGVQVNYWWLYLADQMEGQE